MHHTTLIRRAVRAKRHGLPLLPKDRASAAAGPMLAYLDRPAGLDGVLVVEVDVRLPERDPYAPLVRDDGVEAGRVEPMRDPLP